MADTSSVDIHLMAENSPLDLIRRLMDRDMPLWEAVKNQVLNPFFANNATYRRRIADVNIELDDIFREVFTKMVVQEKLLDLRNQKYVCSFILEYAKAYVRSFFEKRAHTVELVYVNPIPDAEEGRMGLNDYAQTPSSCLGDDDLTDEVFLSYKAIRDSFDQLWRSNPRRAIAVLLRYVKRLSSNEVRDFMDLASENYVNQVVNLAKGDLRTSVLSIEDTLRKVQTRHVRTHLTAKCNGGMSQVNYVGRPFTLVFIADELSESDEGWWSASAIIDEGEAPGAGDFGDLNKILVHIAADSEIPILVGNKDGEPLEGDLAIFGQVLAVTLGNASCPLQKLREGLTASEIYFRRVGGAAVGGKLAIR